MQTDGFNRLSLLVFLVAGQPKETRNGFLDTRVQNTGYRSGIWFCLLRLKPRFISSYRTLAPR
jgi:hypothetical protein